MTQLGIDLASLQALTRDAIAAATGNDDKTNAVIERIRQQVRIEVLAGRTHAVAMGLKLDTDYRKGYGSAVDASSLMGLAASVFQRCAPLKPTVDYWTRREGDGRESWTVEGCNIVLHWATPEEACQGISTMGDAHLAESILRTIREARADLECKAKAILAQLPERVRLQGLAGKNFGLVMSVKEGVDYTRPYGSSRHVCQPEWLSPVAAAVWEACGAFRPTLEYWSRRGGVQWDETFEEGFDIVVHW